jgi:putative oxidoreductase
LEVDVIDKYLGRFSSQFYALLRIVSGFLFLLHGTQKLLGFPPSGRPAAPLNAMMTAAGVIEIIAGLMILIGFFAGLAAFIASGEMAVAYFMVHQPNGALPIQNGGEAAALFAFIFLYIASRGSGIWSVDSLLSGRDTVAGTRREPTAVDV